MDLLYDKPCSCKHEGGETVVLWCCLAACLHTCDSVKINMAVDTWSSLDVVK